MAVDRLGERRVRPEGAAALRHPVHRHRARRAQGRRRVHPARGLQLVLRHPGSQARVGEPGGELAMAEAVAGRRPRLQPGGGRAREVDLGARWLRGNGLARHRERAARARRAGGGGAPGKGLLRLPPDPGHAQARQAAAARDRCRGGGGALAPRQGGTDHARAGGPPSVPDLRTGPHRGRPRLPWGLRLSLRPAGPRDHQQARHRLAEGAAPDLAHGRARLGPHREPRRLRRPEEPLHGAAGQVPSRDDLHGLHRLRSDRRRRGRAAPASSVRSTSLDRTWPCWRRRATARFRCGSPT